jgi:hypothetical protein
MIEKSASPYQLEVPAPASLGPSLENLQDLELVANMYSPAEK